MVVVLTVVILYYIYRLKTANASKQNLKQWFFFSLKWIKSECTSAATSAFWLAYIWGWEDLILTLDCFSPHLVYLTDGVAFNSVTCVPADATKIVEAQQHPFIRSFSSFFIQLQVTRRWLFAFKTSQWWRCSGNSQVRQILAGCEYNGSASCSFVMRRHRKAIEHIPSVSFFCPHFVDQSFNGSLNATLEHTTLLLPFSITMMGSSLLAHLQRNLIKSSLLRF